MRNREIGAADSHHRERDQRTVLHADPSNEQAQLLRRAAESERASAGELLHGAAAGTRLSLPSAAGSRVSLVLFDLSTHFRQRSEVLCDYSRIRGLQERTHSAESRSSLDFWSLTIGVSEFHHTSGVWGHSASDVLYLGESVSEPAKLDG